MQITIMDKCLGCLASKVDATKDESVKPEDVPVVRNFMDVFPKELPGLPLDLIISSRSNYYLEHTSIRGTILNDTR